jgi:phage terminase large subunit-like protein
MTQEDFEAKIKAIEEQKDTLKFEKLRLQTEERCRDFVPNGHEEKVINAIKPETFILIDSAANGVGKTALQANMIAAFEYGPINSWFKTPFFENFKRPWRGRIISDATIVQEKIVPELEKWLIRGTYKAEKGGKNYLSRWKFPKTGDYFDIMTYDQEAKEFEGTDLNWWMLDEKPVKSIYSASVARLRYGGFIFIAFAPLSASSWVFDDIVDRADGKKIVVIYGDAEENCIEHGIRGQRRHQDIIDQAAEYDPDEREARLHGRPQKFYGRVHKIFDRTVHGIDRLPPDQYSYYMILDPHDARPPAISWGAVNYQGHKFTIDEWPNEPFHKMKSCTLDFDDITKIIKHKEVDLKIDGKIEKRILDPWWHNHKYPNSQLTVAQEYAKRGIRFAPRLKLFDAFEETARKQLNEHLKYEKDPNDPTKFKIYPRWYVLNHCYNHIYALEHWVIGELRGRAVESKEPKEEPEEKHQCFPKLLYYFLMASPRFVIPQVVQVRPEKTPEEKRFGKAGY